MVLHSFEYIPIESCKNCTTLKCCMGLSIALCSQWFKRIFSEELQTDTDNDGFLPLFLSLSHFSSLSPVFSLHPSHISPFSIFSGSSDYPPSLGCKRLRSKLPSVCPNSQAREQVPRQICRWAVSVKSNTLAVKVCVCLLWLQLLLFHHIRIQEIIRWHLLKKHLPDSIVLSPVKIIM